MKLTDAYNLFIENRKTYCVDETLRNYSFTLSYFFSFCVVDFGVPVEQIDVSCVDIHLLNRYSIYLKDKPKNNTGSEPIASRTRKDYLKDVCTFFNFLCDFEYVEKNPCDKLKLPRVEQSVVVPLKSCEVDTLISQYNQNTFLGSRNIAIIRCLLDQGMRSGEVQRLLIRDLHLDDDYIYIRKSKNYKSRILPLSAPARQALETYLKKREIDSEYVFISRSGEAFSADAMKDMFARLKKKVQFEELYPHLLRHTFATSFILGGGSVELLRIYMGHSDISTTQGYLHLCENLRFMDDIYQIDKCFKKQFY